MQEREWEIEELLHRRSDLSTFVIHWTRKFEGATGLDNLKGMLSSRRIKALTPLGAGVYTLHKMAEKAEIGTDELQAALRNQRVACFTEAPLEQAWSIVCTIKGRAHPLEPYGLAFTKREARTMGINPVWYVDMTPGHDWLINYVDALVRRAVRAGDFAADPISEIAPFVEGMGTWPTGRKEFWWEREWRYRGDVNFSPYRCAVVLCPEQHFDDVRPLVKAENGRSVPVIDPHWGLEHIIAKLSGAPEV